MNINYIKCKNALSKSKLPGLDYSLNPYVGCKHNCIYCYAPYILRINRKDWSYNIGIKTNIPSILSKELKMKKKGVIGLSTVTDPYQPIEKEYNLTRYCLEQLVKYDFPVHIQTKSSLINRDIDLIEKLSKPEVMISIGTLNDNERKILEPNSSSINERLKILKTYSRIGIKTSVFLGPIYPTINKNDILKMLDIFIKSDVKEIMLDSLNLKYGIWNNISSELKEYPKIKNKFDKEKFANKKLIDNIYQIIKNKAKHENIKISTAF